MPALLSTSVDGITVCSPQCIGRRSDDQARQIAREGHQRRASGEPLVCQAPAGPSVRAAFPSIPFRGKQIEPEEKFLTITLTVIGRGFVGTSPFWLYVRERDAQ